MMGKVGAFVGRFWGYGDVDEILTKHVVYDEVVLSASYVC